MHSGAGLLRLAPDSFCVGKPFQTVVHRRGGFLDPRSGTMRFELEIPNDGGRWVPGLDCVVQLELGEQGG